MPQATVDDFIRYVGEREAVDLSCLDDASNPAVDRELIAMALEDADGVVASYRLRAGAAGAAAIDLIQRRIQLVIARHLLDVQLRRPEVRADYEDAIETLRAASEGQRQHRLILWSAESQTSDSRTLQ